MKHLLKAEEAAQLAIAIFALHLQHLSITWWLWPVVFLSADLGMLGYLHSPRTGAWTYNLFHHKGMALAVAAIGYFLHAPWVMLAGLILLAHSAFDRMMGYGLKFSDSFGHTHLGWVGKARKNGQPA